MQSGAPGYQSEGETRGQGSRRYGDFHGSEVSNLPGSDLNRIFADSGYFFQRRDNLFVGVAIVILKGNADDHGTRLLVLETNDRLIAFIFRRLTDM